MKRVSRGIALTVLSAMLVFNAVCADSFVAYGAAYETVAGSATDSEDLIEQDGTTTEESGADASDFDVPKEETEDVDVPSGDDENGTSISEEGENEESDESTSGAAEDEALSDGSFDEASTEDSLEEEAADESSADEASLEDSLIIEEDEEKLVTAGNKVGDNITYTFSGGVLTLTGKGATYDYDINKNKSPFSSLKGVTTIIVGEGITGLGSAIFNSVGDNNGGYTGTSLKKISLPSTLTTIGEKAFSQIYASGVDNVIIPSSVKSVGKGGLTGYFNNLTFANGTTEIYPYALNGGLVSGTLTIPDTVVRIGDHAFEHFRINTDLTLPTSLKYIGSYAFHAIEGHTIYFKGDAPEIADGAFKRTEENQVYLYPYYLIGYYPRGNKTWTAEKLASFKERHTDIDFRPDGPAATSGKCGPNIDWKISGTTLSLTGYGPMYDYAANNRAPWSDSSVQFSKIEIDNRITTIGNFAFYNLDSKGGSLPVKLPSSLTRIGSFSFYRAQPTGVNLPSGVTYIGDYAFYYNVYMTTSGFKLSSETTYIGDYAFYDCHNAEIEIPKFTKITKIGDFAFNACRKLTGTLEFPDTLTYVGDNAFSTCDSLSGKLRLSKNLTYLGEWAFRSKNIYGDIEIPSGITTIKSYTFEGTQITSLTMGNQVTELKANAFSNCTRLSSVKLSNNLTSLYSVFTGCSLLTEIEIPASVTGISMSGFGNTGIRKIVFKGDFPKSIGDFQSGQTFPMNAEIHYPRAGAGWFMLTDEQKAEKLHLTSYKPKFVPYGDTRKFLVTFVKKNNPSVKLAVQEVEGGKCVDLNAVDLSQEGLVVSGYYYDDPRSSHPEKFDPATPISKDMTIYVSYDDRMCSVTFDPQDGSSKTVYRYKYGSTTSVSYATDPKNSEGHYFVGWSRTPVAIGEGGVRVDDSEKFEVKDDITFYAIWLTQKKIIINRDTCRDNYSMNPIEVDATARARIFPLWDLSDDYGYKFEGWYYDPQYTRKAEENDPIAKPEITLYAKWSRKVHKVHFDTSESDNLESFTVEVPYGESLKEPDVKPVKTGYKFAAWCKEGSTKPYEFDGYTLREDLNLYALFVDPVENENYGDVYEYIRKNTGYYYAEQIPKLGWVYCGNNPTYTGKAIEPSDIRVFYYKKKLKEGVDYTYKLKNNVKPGDAKIIVTFKGGYSGTIEGKFHISPLSLFWVEKYGEMELGADDVYLSYNGKTQKAKNTLKINLNGKMVTLKEGTDFTYEYPTTDVTGKITKDDVLKLPGTYQVKIVGKNNFTSSITFNEHITELVPMSKVKVSGVKNLTYTGEPLTQNALVVKYGSKRLTEGVDFEVDYSNGNNTDIGTATFTLKAIEGSEYAGTKTATFKITGTPLSKMSFTGFKSTMPYNDGKAVTQDVKIYTSAKAAKDPANNEPLVKDIDYTLTYEGDNKKVGKTTMVFTGKGKYSGVVKKSFRIVPADLKGDDGIAVVVNTEHVNKLWTLTEGQTARVVAVVNPSYSYMKKGVKPSPTLYGRNSSGGYSLLSKSKDYTLSYGSNSKVGEQTGFVKITCKGNYKGTASYRFDITKGSFGICYLIAPDVKYKKAKGNCRTSVTVTDRAGAKLVSGKDYSLEYHYADGTLVDLKKDIVPENAIITAVVRPLGNYEFKDESNSMTDEFRVYTKDRDIAGARIVIKDKYYHGNPVYIESADDILEATLGGKDLNFYDEEKGGDFYDYSYSNNAKTGTAKVTFWGYGEYAGAKTVTFKIIRRNLAN
ncbi:MAG: hypothetical protein E7307_11665 [Butyrivibrio sp.]|nr:hypothetical protein [Butyrivibrio sp.]